MKKFTIKDLEYFSGIKAHTLRIWEQRYSVLNPQRSKTNFRYYTLEDVNRLLLISLLNKAGLKISQIAYLDFPNIESRIAKLASEEQRQNKATNDLISCMLSMKTEEFEGVLDKCLREWNVHTTITKIIIPFLERVNILSYSDQSSEVHFAVTAIRNKIILGIEKLNVSAKIEKKALLFLPEEEHFDLILLYLNYIIKSHGLKVLYMGTNISIGNLKNVIKEKQPDYLITYLSGKQRFQLNEVLKYLEENLPQSVLVVAKHENLTLHKEDHPNLKIIHPEEVLNIIS